MKRTPLKYLSGKVAVVYGTASPVAALVCLKLLQLGARLLLIHEEDSEISLDLNLVFGGLDTNECSERYTDPWGAKAVAAHLKRKINDERRIVNCCVEFFGRQPDLVVDVNWSLSCKSLVKLLRTSEELKLMCIQPLSHEGLFSRGWLGDCESENLNPKSVMDSVSVFAVCPVQAIKKLNLNEECCQLVEDVTQSDDQILVFKTDALVIMLAYVLYGGLHIKSSVFSLDGSDTLPTDETCRLSICSIPRGSLGVSQKEAGDGGDRRLGSSGRQTKIQLDQELDDYFSSDSDLLNNGTFDAVLQKAKDYPVDWWQGGADCFVSMDDINCKAITRAFVNFTFRWLVLGYFVLGFAVPRALGWEGT